MKNIVITIGREYGSGGKYIGEEVAKRLNIAFYDKELLHKIYEENGCNYSLLEAYDEQTKNSFLKALGFIYTDNPESAFTEEKYYELVRETIQKIASFESCVLLGRNTNQILKDQKNVLHFFIYAKDEEFKIQRKMKIENLSYDEAKEKMYKVDKMRKKYYETFNKSHWGDKYDYDFCIDSSKLGIEKTIDLIADIVKRFMEGQN